MLWPTLPLTRWAHTGSLCWPSSSLACCPRPACDSSPSSSSPCSNRLAACFQLTVKIKLKPPSSLYVGKETTLLSLYWTFIVCLGTVQKAFRTGTSTRLDDRVFSMCQLKYQPLAYAMLMIHPALYRVDDLTDEVRMGRLLGTFSLGKVWQNGQHLGFVLCFLMRKCIFKVLDWCTANTFGRDIETYLLL